MGKPPRSKVDFYYISPSETGTAHTNNAALGQAFEKQGWKRVTRAEYRRVKARQARLEAAEATERYRQERQL